MNINVLNFLRRACPYLLLVALWRLAVPVWNPAGILALIPIFYCSFVRPVPWFAELSVIFCFLIDYSSNTLFFWTSLYCLIYALNGFQTFFDLPRAPNNALVPFSVFVGTGILILFFAHIGWANLGRDVWTFIWLCALYQPITILIARAQNDR